MYAYRFAGYWRDVGTIDSLWEANMEVLDPENSGIDIFDKTWKIYSRNPVLPAQKIGERAVVQDSLHPRLERRGGRRRQDRRRRPHRPRWHRSDHRRRRYRQGGRKSV